MAAREHGNGRRLLVMSEGASQLVLWEVHALQSDLWSYRGFNTNGSMLQWFWCCQKGHHARTVPQ
jgi:hypothetical protein